MIKSIEIKNFKSIKKKLFHLKNLNLLFGLNGMGKSSFIQTLLALRQSSSLGTGRLDLNNSNYIKLGNTKDVLYQYSKDKNLSLNIKFSENKELNMQFKYEPEADSFHAINQENDIYGESSKFRTFLNEALFSKNFQYLNANRIEPRLINLKNYTSVVNNRDIGNQGEFTAHYIEVFFDDDIEFENCLHEKSKITDSVKGEEIINRKLINQINLWMGEISPNINVRTTSISNDNVMLEYVFKQKNFGNTNRFKPENVGFGISYVLPIVVSLLSARAGELIIIENPESHIHPKGQAELGKLIALVAQNDVQIIVETHSDHILNGIRVAVKENNIDKNKVISFYFAKEFEPTEQYSRITDIEIDRNGTLSEYPPNFLDEWSNQLSKLV